MKLSVLILWFLFATICLESTSTTLRELTELTKLLKQVPIRSFPPFPLGPSVYRTIKIGGQKEALPQELAIKTSETLVPFVREPISLVLANNQLQNLDRIGKLVGHNPHIQLLDLSNNTLECTLPLHVISFHKTLKSLNLSYNRLSQKTIDKVFSGFFWENSSLKKVNLSGNSITDGNFLNWGGIRNRGILETLKFDSSHLTDSVIQQLSQGLPSHTHLIKLSLTNNQIGDKGAQILSSRLRSHPALQILNLRNNLIGDEGAQSLAILLKENSALRCLDLTGNLMGLAGIRILVEALGPGHKILRLSLA